MPDGILPPKQFAQRIATADPDDLYIFKATHAQVDVLLRSVSRDLFRYLDPDERDTLVLWKRRLEGAALYSTPAPPERKDDD